MLRRWNYEIKKGRFRQRMLMGRLFEFDRGNIPSRDLIQMVYCAVQAVHIDK